MVLVHGLVVEQINVVFMHSTIKLWNLAVVWNNNSGSRLDLVLQEHCRKIINSRVPLMHY